MAKIILEFDETERDVANLAINSVAFWSDVDDLRDTIRDNLKYEKPLTMDEVYQELCEIQARYPLS